MIIHKCIYFVSFTLSFLHTLFTPLPHLILKLNSFLLSEPQTPFLPLASPDFSPYFSLSVWGGIAEQGRGLGLGLRRA